MPLTDRRIASLAAVFVVLLGIAAARTAYLGAIKGGHLQRQATQQQITVLKVPAVRGSISDRNGVDLAVSEPADDVAADPYLVRRPFPLAQRIAPILRRPVNEVARKLGQDAGFVYLARQVPAARAQRLQKLHAGLQLLPSTRRIYPQRWLASQVLGTVGIEGKGLSGLEYSQQSVLGGSDGERRLVNDALGRPIGLQDVHTAKSGSSMTLTLDAAIQEKVEGVLRGIGQTYQPKGATALVMDPRTGELLAVANWPLIDANDVSGAPGYARQDRAVAANYEPGSTFKPVTVSGALEDHVVTPSTSFNLAPALQVADRTIHDAEDRGWATMTTAQILAQSSNIGAVTIGLRLGKERFSRWVSRFGFGRATGIGLPGEATGIVLPVEKYSGSSMGNMPMGQGLAVTPLQMAKAYSAIANGGILREPRVVKTIAGKPVPAPRGHRVISAHTASQIRTMLEGVLKPGGTASEVSIPGYTLAGKTGTAQKPDPRTGGYSKTKYVASFVGFAPARHPKVLVSVMVDEPQGAIYGGQVAAPAFQRIMEFVLPYLRIPPQ